MNDRLLKRIETQELEAVARAIEPELWLAIDRKMASEPAIAWARASSLDKASAALRALRERSTWTFDGSVSEIELSDYARQVIWREIIDHMLGEP